MNESSTDPLALQRERNAIWRRGHAGDEDIPLDVQYELYTMSSPTVTYAYLSSVWRRGRASGIARILEQIQKDAAELSAPAFTS